METISIRHGMSGPLSWRSILFNAALMGLMITTGR
jgi:hypothetical protein